MENLKKSNFSALCAGVIFFAFLFVFTDEFTQGLGNGLAICAKTVIPSLFPFLIAAYLTGSGEIPEKIGKRLSAVSQAMFNLPAETLPAIILAQLGGFLSGAKSAQSLCRSGAINESQARRLVLFAFNSGMGFSVNALGSSMLGSRESGRIILISLCLSSLILGFLTKFLPDDRTQVKKLPQKHAPLSAAVVESVSSSASAMLTACAFVAIFSGIIAVAEAHIENGKIRLAAVCLLEVTNGCMAAAGKTSLPMLAAVCAFGGICIHMQVFAIAKEMSINIFHFYVFRIFHAVLAFAVCSLLLHFFPIEEQVFLSFSPNAQLWSFSAPASVSLLFLSALLILDLDNNPEIC